MDTELKQIGRPLPFWLLQRDRIELKTFATFAYSKPEIDEIIENRLELLPIGYALERVDVEGG